MVYGLHIYSSFLTSGHLKRLKIFRKIHPFMYTFTHRRRCQPCRATASSSGAVRVRRLAQGHLDTRTRDLPVSSLPALPPEPRAAHVLQTYTPATTQHLVVCYTRVKHKAALTSSCVKASGRMEERASHALVCRVG